jgi:hypothetical protein
MGRLSRRSCRRRKGYRPSFWTHRVALRP